MQHYLLFIPLTVQLAMRFAFICPLALEQPPLIVNAFIHSLGPCQDQQFFDMDGQHTELSVAMIRKLSASMLDSHVCCLHQASFMEAI